MAKKYDHKQKIYVELGKRLEQQLAIENEAKMIFNLMKNKEVSEKEAMKLMGIEDEEKYMPIILQLKNLCLEDEEDEEE